MAYKKLNNYVINPEKTILDAMALINKNEFKTLVVTNKNVVNGVLSEGDLRRYIINSRKLDDKIKNCYNKKFLFFNQKQFTLDKVKKIFSKKNYNYDLIPVIDDKFKLIKIFFNEKISPYKFQLKKNMIFILAGGIGSRLKPLTDILPKALMPFRGEPILIKIIKSFVDQNFGSFTFALQHKSQIIKTFVSNFNFKKKLNLKYIVEKKPLGTLGSLSYLKKNKKNNPIIVTNCDILLNIDYNDLLNFHVENKYDLTIVASTFSHKIPYGKLIMNKTGQLQGFLEKPTTTILINVGAYIFGDKALKFINKEYTDFDKYINLILKKKVKIGTYPIHDSSWKDIGEWQEFYKNN